MSPPSQSQRESNKLARASRIQEAISSLEEQIRSLESTGEVAPGGCHVERYQARGQRKAYWYYKLQATAPKFPTAQGNKLSRYKHLGAAGSPAHVEGILQVVRRVQIDELQKAIDALKDSWADLYD